jgi:hypothetical protein
MKKNTPLITALLLCSAMAIAELPQGYWTAERTQPILAATLKVTLDADLAHLTAAETRALAELLAAGRIMHALYEDQLHPEANSAKQALDALHFAAGEKRDTTNLLDLYYLSKGPIVTTLDNERLPFLPVADAVPGKNVYPQDLTREEFDAYVQAHPGQSAPLLAERTVVRRATAGNIAADLEMLGRYPGVDVLHSGLRNKLEALGADASRLYAVPYALAYAPALHAARNHLDAAAAILDPDAPDFAAYLRNRGRDLLSGDYESGDASWVSAEFRNLNLQFGSYETYNDSLLGVKAFYSASLLARDEEKSRALAAAMTELQSIEDSLPYDHQKRVRSQVPVGVYNVVADFGQARGANTATILPNDADHARKYGRIVLIRNNILTDPKIFENSKRRYAAALDPDFHEHLTMDGGFNRTLWHEIGHYLGVSATADGQSLGEALAEYADFLEEMKSDLVSLYAAPRLQEIGYYDANGLRAHYADGIRRTLQVVRPRPEQPYQNMQLMQFNFYMEYGLIEPGGESALLTINYDRYHQAVSELLADVLQLQYAGDYELARAFIERWSYWDEMVHGRLAKRMQQGARYRNTMVRYAILGH